MPYNPYGIDSIPPDVRIPYNLCEIDLMQGEALMPYNPCGIDSIPPDVRIPYNLCEIDLMQGEALMPYSSVKIDYLWYFLPARMVNER